MPPNSTPQIQICRAHDIRARTPTLNAPVLASHAHDTVCTDAFALNAPPHSASPVMQNSVTDALGHTQTDHHSDRLAGEIIAHKEGRPLRRITSSDLQAVSDYAGNGATPITSLPSAAQRIAVILPASRHQNHDR